MDLFDYSLKEQIKRDAPLADRMRPRTLDEFAGQPHILSAGRLLRRAIQADQLSSLIFFGPPGTGKTTLAQIIANTTRAQFLSLNAVLSGVKNIRESIAEAKKFREEFRRRTILFIDEVHRFNKAQQDALLPHVENGTIILIGATTENPYFEVNKALVSRSRIFQLKSLEKEDLIQVLDSALADSERGYGRLRIHIDREAKDHLAGVANGDARALLNALELAVVTSQPDREDVIRIDLTVAEESIQKKAVLYDKDGDAHFDTISAFIKSLRGSDPDAALYWMAKMIYGGEDPKFVFRRMIIFAGEDVGLADPQALRIVMSAAQAFDYVGMPEGRFHLAEACLYLATAPKSNSGFAFFDALAAVHNEKNDEVPNHLRDASRDKEGFGHGQGYLYPHSYRDHWVAQQYLPETLQGRVFYQPTDRGYEAQVKENVVRYREAQLAAMLESLEIQDRTQEEHWQGRTLGDTGELLAVIRDQLFSFVSLERDSMILNLNAGTGLLLGEALRLAPEGTIYALVNTDEEKNILENQYLNSEFLFRPVIRKVAGKNGGIDLSDLLSEKMEFDAVIGRNSLTRYSDKTSVLKQLGSLLKNGGSLVLAESIPAFAQRLSGFLPEDRIPQTLKERVLTAEDKIYSDKKNDRINWNDQTLLENIESAGFRIEKQIKTLFQNKTLIQPKRIEEWFSLESTGKRSYAHYLQEDLKPPEIQQVKNLLQKEIVGKVVQWKTTWLFVKARAI
ncbi:MAG: AAA family ATPase [Proteobacteria bacterium]|nr:AAA family ATPase [Pseudomonadota bacterium]